MYHIFDVSLFSDISLPELPKGTIRSRTIDIKIGSVDDRAPPVSDWYYEWQDVDGETCLLSAKINDDYLLRFPELADFLISFSNGNRVLYFPEKDVPEQTIRHLLLDQVIPRILSHQGYLVLHASAIKLENGKAVIFLGETGRGKSTLASSYYVEGSQLVTDDCLLVKFVGDEVFCVPNYAGLRLYPDSIAGIFKEAQEVRPVAHYTDKRRLELKSAELVADEPILVSAIFLLQDSDDNESGSVFVDKIQGAEEIVSIVSQAFLLDTKNKEMLTRQFANVSRLNTISPILFSLNYPREYGVLAEVRDLVKETIELL